MDISYNVKRPHIGHNMNDKTPLEKIQELGYTIDETFAMFPVVKLDEISTDWIVSMHGNDVFATDRFRSMITTVVGWFLKYFTGISIASS